MSRRQNYPPNPLNTPLIPSIILEAPSSPNMKRGANTPIFRPSSVTDASTSTAAY